MVRWSPFDVLDGLNAEELRQRLAALQATIARAPIPIAIAHDPECRFISANRALAALLRMPTESNISLTPPPGEQPPYRIQQNGRDIPGDELPMQYAVARRMSMSNEIEIVRADGSVLYVQNDVEPLFDTHGNIYGCVSARAAGCRAEIVVADTGIGIPPELLPRVFDMFTQLQPHRDRTFGGLGIGLSLAKRLVELHDGTIEAQSDGPGRGSTFTIRLPLAAAAGDEEPAAAKDGRAPSGCRVLIAEDNADAAEMMHVMIEVKGYDVRVVNDGTDAVAVAATFQPHIAFLDIGMPVMDGYEAARRIRAALGDAVVLIALTGWGQDEDKRRSREAGFDHHLTKPPEPEMIERLIAECGRKRT